MADRGRGKGLAKSSSGSGSRRAAEEQLDQLAEEQLEQFAEGIIRWTRKAAKNYIKNRRNAVSSSTKASRKTARNPSTSQSPPSGASLHSRMDLLFPGFLGWVATLIHSIKELHVTDEGTSSLQPEVYDFDTTIRLLLGCYIGKRELCRKKLSEKDTNILVVPSPSRLTPYLGALDEKCDILFLDQNYQLRKIQCRRYKSNKMTFGGPGWLKFVKDFTLTLTKGDWVSVSWDAKTKNFHLFTWAEEGESQEAASDVASKPSEIYGNWPPGSLPPVGEDSDSDFHF